MNNNFKFLLLGTSLSLIPTLIQAQCVASTDCASLGYTETSCPDGKGLKCPFGNTFACPSSETGICEKNGFKYDCKGTGYASGNSPACGNKFTSCACAGGYEWIDGKCTAVLFGSCTGRAKNCQVGQILNADGSCSDYRKTGTEPIGIVAYISPQGCGQAIALEKLSRGIITWGKTETDIPDIANYPTLEEAKKDFNSCNNTKKIMEYAYKQYGDSAYNYYSAFKTALDYAPTTLPETKGKWCLPALGILNNIMKENTKIKASMEKLGLNEIRGAFWSSTEASANTGWVYNKEYRDSNKIFSTTNKDSGIIIDGGSTQYQSPYPVIEF